MTGGREKKPLDYEIPGSGRMQERVFDDDEPLTVDGRRLMSGTTARASGQRPQGEATPGVAPGRSAKEAAREDRLLSLRHLPHAAAAVAGLLAGILLTRALTEEADGGALQIMPLASIERGIVKSVEPGPAGRVVLSVDFGPHGVLQADLQGIGPEADELRGCAVAALLGAPGPDKTAQASAVVLGLLEGEATCDFDPRKRP